MTKDKTKTCSKCGFTLPVEMFESDRRTCLECRREYYRQRNSSPERIAYNRAYAASYRRDRGENGREYDRKRMSDPKRIEYMRNYYKRKYQERKEEYKKHNKAYMTKVRRTVLEAYGNKCACCGETNSMFLSLDHVNGGGAEHRREVGSSSYKVYRDVIRQGFPAKFRILCFNCNMAMGFYGFCPHQGESEFSPIIENLEKEGVM